MTKKMVVNSLSLRMQSIFLHRMSQISIRKDGWQNYNWLKLHLTIKRLCGTTENTVRIQISVAIITCLVAIVQHDMRLERSTYEVLQIPSVSLTDKTHLRDLFDKTYFNGVKDQFGPLIPGVSEIIKLVLF